MLARILLTLALLLISSSSWAGAEMAMAFFGRSVVYATSINGISSLSSSGIMDTGAQTFTLTTNPITVAASCSSSAAGVQSDVTLYVDGAARDAVICDNSSTSKTLTYTPTAGSHTVQIQGTTDNPSTGAFSASSFRIPGTP